MIDDGPRAIKMNESISEHGYRLVEKGGFTVKLILIAYESTE